MTEGEHFATNYCAANMWRNLIFRAVYFRSFRYEIALFINRLGRGSHGRIFLGRLRGSLLTGRRLCLLNRSVEHVRGHTHYSAL